MKRKEPKFSLWHLVWVMPLLTAVVVLLWRYWGDPFFHFLTGREPVPAQDVVEEVIFWFGVTLITTSLIVSYVARQQKELRRERDLLRRAEGTLRESEETAKALLNAPTDFIALVDERGTILALNETMRKGLIGILERDKALRRKIGGPDKFIGSYVYDFFPPDIARFKKAQADKVFRTGKAIRFEEASSNTWFDTVVYPLFDKQGNVTRVAVIARDVTERKQAEKKLRKHRNHLKEKVEERTAELRVLNEQLRREITKHRQAEKELKSSEERLRILFEFAPDGIYLNDLKGNFVDGNKAAEELIGYKREELIGKNFLKLKLLPPEQIPKAAESLAKNALGKSTGPEEYTLNRKDGHQVEVEIRTHPVEIEDQTLVLGIVRDITEHKKAEEEIYQGYQIQTILNKLLQISLKNISLEEMLKQVIDCVTSTPWLALRSKGGIFLVEDEPKVLVMKSQRGLTKPLQTSCAHIPFGRCLCGRAAQLGEIVFADHVDERHQNRYKGISPHGHYCVPIVSTSKKVLGVINLYLQEGHHRDKTEEEFLRAVANVLAGIIERRQAEEKLRCRLSGEEVLESISTNLMREKDLDKSMNVSLEALGRLTEVDRTYVFEMSSDGRTMSNTYEWCLVGTSPQIQNLQNVEAAAAPWWMKKLEKNEDIIIKDVDKLPREARAEKEILKAQDTRSLLAVPMYFEDELVGFLGFDDTKGARLWPQEDVTLLRAASEAIALAIMRKGAEDELRKSEERYRNVFELSPGGIITLNTKSVITSCNAVVEELLGYSKDEIVGKRFTQLRIIQPRDLPALLKRLSYMSIGEAPKPVEMECLRKDKSSIWLEVSFGLLKENDRVTGYQVVLEDISERKKAEREREKAYHQLRDTQAQLVQAGKMVAMGELAASVAHELNQPLAGILGFSQLVLSEIDKKSPLRKDLLQIEEQSRRMSSIVENVRTFARQSTPEMVLISLNTPIKKALDLTQQQLKNHNIEIVTNLSPGLPRVKADSNQLQQVFLNLISNARDALDGTQKGNRKLTVSTKTQNNRVIATFSDNGYGMDRRTKRKAFEPFFSTKEGKTASSGLGLGLSVSYGIIKNHSGEIDISSQRGKGTTVTISLPVAKS